MLLGRRALSLVKNGCTSLSAPAPSIVGSERSRAIDGVAGLAAGVLGEGRMQSPLVTTHGCQEEACLATGVV